MVNDELKGHIGSEGVWKKRAEELVDKNILEENQQETLKKMINSPDKENFVVAKEIISLKLEDKLMEGLNDGQKAAFTSILDFFRDPKEHAVVLKGYAGTGKTFLVKRIIEYIAQTHPSHKIAITAPTNKAVNVLYMNAPFSKNSQGYIFEDLFNSSSRITYATIHKLLGLKEQITANGQQLFQVDPRNKSGLDQYKVLIVDEVSMLDDNLCTEILKFHEKVNIIFMGDPCQIPPVSKTDCIPFSKQELYEFKRLELSEIMRQKGTHPVVDSSFIIRNNISKAQPIPVLSTILNEKGHGIVHIDASTERSTVRPLLQRLFKNPNFEKDANYAKVIAWRNATVDYMNKVIREILYGENPDTYVVGEKLVARGPIFKKVSDNRFGDRWMIKFYTSEEMEIEKVTIKDRVYIYESGSKLYAKMYELNVKSYDPVEQLWKRETIKVIHEDSLKDYNDLLTGIKKTAMKLKSKEIWVGYFNLMKWSADVAYNYAITAHKSQGSTYKNVFLVEEDLDFNRKVVERNRIKYTAYSRPTDKLFILRNKNV